MLFCLVRNLTLLVDQGVLFSIFCTSLSPTPLTTSVTSTRPNGCVYIIINFAEFKQGERIAVSYTKFYIPDLNLL